MSYRHYIPLLVALLLIGCTQTDSDDALTPEEPAAAIPLQFSATTVQWPDDDAPATRAAIGSATELGTPGFGVIAFQTKGNYPANIKPNYLYNEKVTGSSGKWTYTNTKLWPANDDNLISVFAYAPHNGTGIAPSASNYEGDPYVSFTMDKLTGAAAITETTTDLLYADPKLNLKRSTDAGIAKTVDLAFHHALAKVGITIVKNVTEAALQLTKVELSGSFNTAGQLSLRDSSWSSLSTPEAFTLAWDITGDASSTTGTYTTPIAFLVIPQEVATTVTLTFTATLSSGATQTVQATATPTITYTRNKQNVLKFTITDETHFKVITSP